MTDCRELSPMAGKAEGDSSFVFRIIVFLLFFGYFGILDTLIHT
jgi:hypothetical protein